MLYNSLEVQPKNLKEVYKIASEKLYEEKKNRQNVIKLSNSDKAKLSGNLPSCISYILKKMPATSELINFNKLVMTLVTYFQMATLSKNDAWTKVEHFVETYSHSETYDTKEKRIEHWRNQWNYLKTKSNYSFACSYIKGLKLSKSAFDCSKCIDKRKTPSSFSSNEVFRAFKQNEDGDATLLIELYKNHLCFDHASGIWYIRKKEGHWKEDQLDQATANLKKVVKVFGIEVKRQNNRRLNAETNDRTKEAEKIKDIVDKLYKRIKALQTKKRKSDVLKLAAAGENTLGITGSEWDRTPWLLGCKNGIIDFRDGKLKPVDPKAYIKTVAPTKWKGMNTPCPTWERFLCDIFNKDAALIDFIQRLFGYSMIGEVPEDIFPIFWGEEGRNGKDTLFETIKYVLGDFASPIESELLLAQRFNKRAGSPRPEVLALRGKRIVWASETEKDRKFDTAKIKAYTGGGVLSARGLYAKRNVEFAPSFTIFLITNPKPKVKDDDPAFWERVFLIPMTQRFVKFPKAPNEHKADIYMPKKLQKDAAGILAWLVRGCLEWQCKGFDPPDTVLQATQEYKLEEDDLLRFEHDCCIRGPKDKIQAGKLFQAYGLWALGNSDEKIPEQTFYKRMLKRVDGSKKTNKGNFYIGIDLNKTWKEYVSKTDNNFM